MGKISHYLLLICLIFAPLAFGSVETWALLFVEALIMVSAGLYSLHVLIEKRPFYSVPGIIPLIVLCELVIIQIIPLPQGLIKIISPSTWNLYNDTVGVFRDIQFMTISVNKSATLSEFLRLTSYVIFYAVSVQILSEKNNLKSQIKTITVFGFLLAFSSVCQLFLRKDYALWFRHIPENSMIVGPYICHNHYAGLMEMIFPLSLMLYIHSRPIFTYGTIKERIIDSLNNKKISQSVIYGFFSLVIALSVFLSLSRGGIISLCAATALFFALHIIFRSGGRAGTVLPITALVLILMSISWFGWDDITRRFQDIKIEVDGKGYSRLAIWQDCVPLIKDFILTGTGPGTFRNIFPAYRTFHGDRIIDHAHNDYLELFSDYGAAGIILIGLFLISIIITSFRIFLKRRDRHSILVFIASLSGIVSILIHSVFDFNMQIPANALYFFMLCAIMIAGTASRTQKSGEILTYLDKSGKLAPTILLLSSIVFFAAVILVHGRSSMAEYSFSKISDQVIDEKTDPKTLRNLLNTTNKIIDVYPIESAYQLAAAKVNYLLGNKKESLNCFEKAVLLNSTDSDVLFRAGLFFNDENQKNKAAKLLCSSVKFNASGPREHMEYADFLMKNGRKSESLDIIRKMLLFYNGNMKKLMTDIQLTLGISIDELFEILPDRSVCLTALGEIAAVSQMNDVAEKAFNKSQECIDSSTATFMTAADYFMKNNKNHIALLALKKAEEKFPDDTRAMSMLARLYENLGVTYRAKEEYRKILLIDPSNTEARKKLIINF